MQTQEQPTRVKLSERALYQRINRKLKQADEQLRVNRSDKWSTDLGRYFIVDLQANAVTSSHHNLEDLAQELGVIRPWEELANAE